jgi:hypothetical protein
MYKRSFLLKAVTVMLATLAMICFVAPQPASGILLYDNGPSTHSGGTAIGHFIAADDFVLGTNYVITGASVDVFETPGTVWDGTVEWWMLNDSAGTPGSVAASGTGQNIVQSNVSGDDFTVDFDFGVNISITAGDTNWLALHLMSDYSSVSMFWDYTAGVTNNTAYKGGVLVGGVPDFSGGGPVHSQRDVAFRIFGDAAQVPEPATMLLIGTGLVGLVGIRRKLKS